MATAFTMMMWLGVATQTAKSQGFVENSQNKPVSIDNCPILNATISNVSAIIDDTLPTTQYKLYLKNHNFVSLT